LLSKAPVVPIGGHQRRRVTDMLAGVQDVLQVRQYARLLQRLVDLAVKTPDALQDVFVEKGVEDHADLDVDVKVS
jgi:hypothetical protein